jgi:uncharacterized protein
LHPLPVQQVAEMFIIVVFNQVSRNHTVTLPKQGDFLVDNEYTFEIGGKNKTNRQIANLETAFIAANDIDFGFQNKIPLWLFGFLY